MLFAYLAVRKVDFSEVVRVLGTVQFGWLSVATLIYLSTFLVRALRWRQILRDQRVLSFRQVIVPVLVGYMANNVLPARTGEIYRAHFLGRRARMSRSGVVGSIVVERTFDGLMLVGLTLLLLVLFPDTHFLDSAALISGLIFLALAAGILFYGFAVDKTHRMIGKVLGILPRKVEAFFSGKVNSFLQGIRGVSTVRGGLEAVAYTVLIWALEISAVSLAVISFGVALPLSGYLLVYALVALGSTLPSGPAYVGPYQYAFVLALGFFAISRETALAISVAAQVALLGPITMIGVVLLWREQLRSIPPPAQKEPKPEGEKVG